MTDKRTRKGISRRGFLGGALTLGAGLALSNPFSNGGMVQKALADTVATDRYFIFCYFEGGWCTLVSLDPKDPALFREDNRKITRIQPAFHMLPAGFQDLVPSAVPGMVFGPYIGDMVRHADKMALIRGISMDTLTHNVGRRRFITGKQPAGLQARGSSLTTVLAGQIGNDTPIPNLSVRVEAYNEDQPEFANAIRVTSVNDLLHALQRSDTPLNDYERAAIKKVFDDTRNCPTDGASITHNQGFNASTGALDLVSRGLAPLFDFSANTPEMQAIRDRYNIDPRNLASGEAQAAMAVTAITSGISRCVNIEAAAALDAHGPTWQYSHGEKLMSGMNLVAAMIDDLQSREYFDTGETWLDHTTIVCFSEFSRTPLVNAMGGRDHHLLNSAFLVGAGIKGGQVIGRSSDLGYLPTPTNLQTGQPDPGGVIVKPEHIHRAILHSVGLTEDFLELRAEPLMAMLQ